LAALHREEQGLSAALLAANAVVTMAGSDIGKKVSMPENA
jgi:hypothetical protein